MRLLLATSNPAKQAVLRWMVEGLPLEPIGPPGPEPRVEEGVTSLRANAEAKAEAWAAAYDLPAVASDGGLEVPALGTRWNPTLTRRAAGEHATDAERAAHLLRLAADLRGAQRTAYRVEALALAWPRTGEGRGAPRVRSWQVRGSPLLLAQTYDPRGVPRGFWLPGVLLYEGGRRLADLDPAGPEALGDHWVRLRAPLRAALAERLGQPDPRPA